MVRVYMAGQKATLVLKISSFNFEKSILHFLCNTSWESVHRSKSGHF